MRGWGEERKNGRWECQGATRSDVQTGRAMKCRHRRRLGQNDSNSKKAAMPYTCRHVARDCDFLFKLHASLLNSGDSKRHRAGSKYRVFGSQTSGFQQNPLGMSALKTPVDLFFMLRSNNRVENAVEYTQLRWSYIIFLKRSKSIIYPSEKFALDRDIQY